MTLVQLRCFAAIVDAGFNITQAAAQVHATQPALSKQLKQLEDALGYRLFLRHGRSLVDLTPAGRQVLEHTRRLLGEARNIRALAANQRAEADGELRIVTTHTQARFVLPPALAALRRAWPRTSIHLEPAADAEVLARLDRGEADVALISSSGSEPAGGVAIPLYRWRRVVVMPRGHALAASGMAPTLAALAEVPLVSYESSSRADSSLAAAFDGAGLQPRLAMTARDADVIKTCVREGIGVGLMQPALPLQPEEARVLLAHAGEQGARGVHVADRDVALFPQRVVGQVRAGSGSADVAVAPVGDGVQLPAAVLALEEVDAARLRDWLRRRPAIQVPTPSSRRARCIGSTLRRRL
jgi:LysR family transcriptional regulator, cys regulon transcriptional activator